MAASDHLGPQFLDLYHRTDAKSAGNIWREKKFIGREQSDNGPEAFFSTEKHGQASWYGSHAVHVQVPEHLASLDDEFPSGEQHYAVPVKSIKPEHILGVSR